MRAAVFKRGGERWSIEEMPEPEPGAEEMVIKVCRCGICGSDVHLTSGSPNDFPTDRVLGHEYSGEVVALGRGVQGFRVGDRVTAMPSVGCGRCEYCRAGVQFLCQSGRRSYMGGYAEYARITSRNSIKLPQTLSFADGALVEPLAVGVRAVNLSRVRMGDSILVLGAGPIALAVVYAAFALGIRQIVVVSRSPKRATLAFAMGASKFVSSGSLDESPSQAKELRSDCVFECIGVPGAIQQSISLTKARGTVVSLGTCAAPDVIDVVGATALEIRLLFSLGYTLDEFQSAARAFDAGHANPNSMITDVVPLARTPETIERLRAGTGDTKVQVDPWMG